MMVRIRMKIEELLSFIIIEGFLLYGVLSPVCEREWSVSARYWEFVLGIIYVLILIKVVLQKNSLAEWILVLGFIGLAEITRITTQTDAVVWFLSGIIIAKNLDLDRILTMDMIVRTVLGGCLFIFPLAGLYPNQANLMIGGRLRSCFGWAHPNEMGLFFLMFCALWLYLRHEKWNWKDLLGMLLLTLLLDCFANSRTSEICILGMIVLEAVSLFQRKRGVSDQKRTHMLSVSALVALLGGCAGTIIFMMISVEGSWWMSYLPETVCSRLLLAHNFWVAEGFSLVGQLFNDPVYRYLDMLYAYLSLNMGVIVLLLFLLLNVVAIWKAWRDQNEKMLMILLIFLVYSLLEHEHLKMINGFYPILLGHFLWTAMSDRFGRTGRWV